MITYNETLIAYFKKNDTDFKKYVNDKFQESNKASFIEFMDNFFFRLGLISTNIKPIENGKWDSQYTLGPNNIFLKEPGSILVTKVPVSRKEAESILSKNVIELLAIINIKEVKQIIEH